MSYHSLYYHLVFRTYKSAPSIPFECNKEMLSYMTQVCTNHNWRLEEANIHLDHVHLLLSLRPVDTPALVVKEIKVTSSNIFKNKVEMPSFNGWAKGYGLFTVSRWDVGKIAAYIQSQQAHHAVMDTTQEFEQLLLSHGVDSGGYFDSNW